MCYFAICFLFVPSFLFLSFFLFFIFIVLCFSCNLSLLYTNRSPVDVEVRHGERKCFTILWLNLSLLVGLRVWALTFTCISPWYSFLSLPTIPFPSPCRHFLKILGETGRFWGANIGGMTLNWDKGLTKSSLLEGRFVLWRKSGLITFLHPLPKPEPYSGDPFLIFTMRTLWDFWR